MEQPAEFAFTPENLAKAQAHIAKYPPGRQASAVLALLDLAQRQHDNWLPRAAMDCVAAMLGMAPIRVYEVATFYTMFNLRPVGRAFLPDLHHHAVLAPGLATRWCRRASGSSASASARPRRTGASRCKEVECLGACVNAPVIQVNDDFYEDLDAASTEALIDALARGETPPMGSARGRQGSAPEGGATTLKDLDFAKDGA